MKIIIGFLALALIILSPALATLVIDKQQYNLFLACIVLGLLIWAGSGLNKLIAKWICSLPSVAEFFFGDPRRANANKNLANATLGAILFFLLVITVEQGIKTREYPGTAIHFILAGLIIIISVTIFIAIPQLQEITKTGFDNTFGKIFCVRLKPRQYVYAKQGYGTASWQLLLPNYFYVLSNREFYTFDLNEFRVQDTVSKLFVEGDDFYVDCWFRLNVNENNLKNRETLDRDTLSIMDGLTNTKTIADQLTGDNKEFMQLIRSAHAGYQNARRLQIANARDYLNNRDNLLQAIQNFTAIANMFKKKINKFFAESFNTPYLISRNIDLNIFNIDIVLSYYFGNTPFNANLITTLDDFVDDSFKKDLADNRTYAKELLTGFVEAVKVLGRPDQIDNVLKKFEQLQQNAGNYINYDTKNLPARSENEISQIKLKDTSAAINEIQQAQDGPLSLKQGDDVNAAIAELGRFLDEPQLHAENADLNLEEFVKSPYFQEHNVDFKLLSSLLLTTDHSILRAPDDALQTSVLKIMLNRAAKK